MLATLRIKNLALVPDLTLELRPGFNVITGETGAGKSVILGAIQLLIGQRADRTLIRSGADSCVVEGVFQTGRSGVRIAPFLEENGLEPCANGELMLRRSFTTAGANRQFVNGSPTSLATLAVLGSWLVDLHGPHEHQSLFQPSRQLEILDAFGGVLPLREAFALRLRERQQLDRERASLLGDDGDHAARIDRLRFQVREIAEARLTPDEEASLQADHQRAAHAARLAELAAAARGALSEADDSMLAQGGRVGRLLQEMQRLDGSVETWVQLQSQAVEVLRELQAGIARYADQLELDPSRLATLEERLDLIQSLKRKYGGSLASILEHAATARRELEALESRDEVLAQLETRRHALEADLRRAGAALTAARERLIPRLRTAVTRELAALGFRQGSFDVLLKTTALEAGEPGCFGLDSVEFQFAPNPGEPALPLRAIASSGEMARVMLAVKTVLAREDDVPVLVFDEIDANVGGATARVVGEKLRSLATEHQVLCITHLAPVAGQGDAHYLVTKDVRAGRTESRITELDPAARTEEIARMLGGVTEASRRHAEELLGRGEDRPARRGRPADRDRG